MEQREVSLDSRLDLRLTNGSAYALFEAKSRTIIIKGEAIFPEALTERGTRHIHVLWEVLRLRRSAFVLLIQCGYTYSQPEQGYGSSIC